jgi:hypothetical protein
MRRNIYLASVFGVIASTVASWGSGRGWSAAQTTEALSDEAKIAVAGGQRACGGTITDCNEPDGCPAGNQRKYVDWHGLIRCTYAFSTCDNVKQKLCKTEYNCDPGCGPLQYPGNPITESACRS